LRDEQDRASCPALPSAKHRRHDANPERPAGLLQGLLQGQLLQGNPDPTQAPVLPEGYTHQAKAVAERRIVLAGYRLADLLKQTMK